MNSRSTRKPGKTKETKETKAENQKRRQNIGGSVGEDNLRQRATRTIYHAARWWLVENTTRCFNLAFEHDSKNHRQRRGCHRWWWLPNDRHGSWRESRCMRHLLINTIAPADWLVPVRTFTSAVDASRALFLSISEKALSFKLVHRLLPRGSRRHLFNAQNISIYLFLVVYFYRISLSVE